MNTISQQSRAAVVQRQQRYFHKILRDVWDRSSFYRDYYADHGIKEKDLPDLAVQDLPFVSKATLMENFDAAITDPRLRKNELERWIEDVQDPRCLYDEGLIVLHSSGSSGKLAIFAYDRRAWQLMNATVATHLPPPPRRGGQTRSKIAAYLASHGHFGGVTTSVLLPQSAYDVLVISLLEATERVVDQLNNFQPDQLGGYSSSIAMLAELAIQGKLTISPETIVVSGDLLTPVMEQRIREAWPVPIYVVYGCSESIYLGIKAPDQEEMTILDDLNLLEILDHDHQSVLPGEAGRVVLTNLYNQTLPILRYELGDYVVRGTTNSPFSTIRDIRGRVNDALPVLLTSGALDSIHPLILASFFAAGLEKVQFVSRGPGDVEVRYTAAHDIDHSVRREFQRVLEMKGALQTSFEVRRVRQIDVDPQTGKLRLVRIEAGPSSFVRGAEEGDLPRSDVRGRCAGPTNSFVKFEKNQIEQSIPDRFERTVRRYPERVAVKGKAGAFTYDALNRWANRLGHAILRRQEMLHEPVALLVEHDSPMIAAILGVLKAGKIYAPLDSAQTQVSLSRILDDTGATLIVTDEKNLSRAQELAGNSRHIVNIDDLESDLSDENITVAISPDAPACILYTTGSTAQPKGVLHNHRNTLHNVRNYTNAFHVCVEDRLTLLHSYSFIMSTVDIFCALLNGAAVCLFDPRAEGIVRLAGWMMEEEITIYNWTSTAFRVFAEALDQKDTFPELRLIVLGGEPVTHKDIQRYKNCLSDDCILVNRLGSTETGNFRLFFVNKETEIKTGIVPAGYAVDGKEVLLLDDHGNELAFNEVGEIAIRSRYLCSGYWRQPELTEEVFLRDPAGSDKRLYMTGDLGLMRPDGCLEYIGRKDSRCKIRGRWVDIMEVETLLTQHQAVRAAVVVAHQYDAGDQRLVAYIVPAEQYRSPGELRRALRLKMPEYMIPFMFVSLDALPLNPNGKLDRRALPPPLWSRAEQDGCVVAPRTPLEEKLAEIWAEVLGLEQVGIYDDFFELGGHSLHAAQVAGRIYNSFQVELPMRSFFEAATIAGLAEIVTEALAQKLKADQLSQVLASIERLSEAQVKKIVSESKMAENNREEQHPRTVVAVIKPDNLRNNDNR